MNAKIWIIVLLCCVAPLYGIEIGDSFDRSNSNAAGYTEIVHGGRWVEVGERAIEGPTDANGVTLKDANGVYITGANDDTIWQIQTNVLTLQYATGYASNTCTVGGFLPADVDMTVKCKAYSDYYGEFYGICYRLANQNAVYQDSGGYYVRLNRAAAQDTITLYYGSAVVATANITIPTSSYATLRAEVVGSSHKIYFEGTKVIDITHTGNTGAGWIGLWGYYAIAYFDDFSAFDITTYDKVSDDFNRSNSKEVGAMKIGGKWQWSENNDGGSNVVIENNTLHLHYDGSHSNISCNATYFKAADIDSSVLIDPYTISYEAYGLSYRLSNAGNNFQESNGYYARLNKYTTPNKAELYYNTTKIGESTITIPSGYSRLRVVAQGTSHKVYFYPNSKDSFDRSNSNALGSIDGYSWTEYEYSASDIKILSNKARFTYNASNPNSSCNVASYRASDVDIWVDITPDTAYKYMFGVGYRFGTASTVYPGEGYYAYLDKDNNKAVLRYQNYLIAESSVTIPSGTVTLRVSANGGRHKMYLNGVMVLDAWDSQKLADGYCGMITGYTTADFDNFVIVGRDVDSNGNKLAACIDITNTGKTDAGHLGCWSWWSAVYFDDFRVDLVPNVRPMGKEFPLMLYSCNSPCDMDKERRFGWNMVHSYGYEYNKPRDFDRQEILNAARRGSCAAWIGLPEDYNLSTPTAAAIIDRIENESAVGWWDMPEELAYDNTDEWNNFEDWCYWADNYDRWQRPRYMYIASNYLKTDIQNYVPGEDIICASIYTTYASQPHAWARWRMEETVAAVSEASRTIGDDYINGQKTPLGVCEMFYENDPCTVGNPPVMTPAGAYHDFWQAITSGARAIAIFTYYHKIDKAGYRLNWDQYCRSASQISGPWCLNEVILDGTVQTKPSVTYNSEPSTVPAYYVVEPNNINTPRITNQSSLDIRRISWNGSTYLFTVNSVTSPVDATINGLPTSKTVEVLFEGRSSSTDASGRLTDTWSSLGVHIYKMSN